MKLDDIRTKIEGLKKIRGENKKAHDETFPFAEINRDTLNNFRKSTYIIIAR
jgi:hypothetical protein